MFTSSEYRQAPTPHRGRAAVGESSSCSAHLLGNGHGEEPTMTGLSDAANDERTARMVLSMLVEPNDPVTGRLLARVGAVEVLRLAERNGEVSGLDSVDTQVWRDHFNTSDVRSITRAAQPDSAVRSPSADPRRRSLARCPQRLGGSCTVRAVGSRRVLLPVSSVARLRDDHRSAGVYPVRGSCSPRARCLRRC